MGLINGALIGLLYAVGTGQSKARYAALGGAAGLGVKLVWDMTPWGQQAKREAAQRAEASRARFEAARAGRGMAGMGEVVRRLNQPEWVWP